jgi:Ca2+-binding EF-hand superfamily protein
LDVAVEQKLSVPRVETFFDALYTKWDDVMAGKPPLEILGVWFRSADSDRNGIIILEELRQVAEAFGWEASVIDLAKAMRQMDRKGNYDGTVQFVEFCQFYGVTVQKGMDPWEGNGSSKCCILL